ncbi:hypothetical protein C0Q70_15118 [Pomacea canaliculata]|uniref:Uncharacterized protein n=1 Tax=Pomacea canaliculata TaxID=400727 RepID=A0A2T7NU04_POMCA|nr:hypothetical protein C0Q70_15118 [Pomacea canaliculata]
MISDACRAINNGRLLCSTRARSTNTSGCANTCTSLYARACVGVRCKFSVTSIHSPEADAMSCTYPVVTIIDTLAPTRLLLSCCGMGQSVQLN